MRIYTAKIISTVTKIGKSILKPRLKQFEFDEQNLWY